MRIFVLFILISNVAHFCNAKVTLVEKVVTHVTFTKNKLKFSIIGTDIPRKSLFVVCFQAITEKKNQQCPSGYKSLSGSISGTVNETLTVMRDGEVISSINDINGRVDLGTENSINLILISVPNGASITLLNGRTNQKTEKTKSNTIAIVGGVVGVLLLIVVISIVGYFVWYCFIRRTPTHTPVPTSAPEEQRHVTANSRTSRQTSSTSATKPSDEKIKIPVESAPKQQVNAQPTTSVIKIDAPVVPCNTAESTLVLKPTHQTNPKKCERKKSSTKSIPSVVKSISPAKNFLKKSPILPVDKTQSATRRSLTTDPTPDFGTDATATSLATNSEYKARAYLRRSEAPVFGSKPKRRSVPVIDEVDAFRRCTETYPCFGERIRKLTGHDHMRLVERIKVTVEHETSDAERKLLKAAPHDAPKFADVILKEAHDRMDRYSLDRNHRSIGWDEGAFFWSMINDPATPASDGYIIMYKIAPEMFKLEKEAITDELIQKMPLCGLYILLLDDKFPYEFRVQLATELRSRAVKVIPYIQKDAMKNVAFPTNYLARAYVKNNKSFVEMREIHSKSEGIL